MHLNTLKPAEGSKKTAKRVGRGIGSGLGKTCGRGHKGQKSRSNGRNKKLGFEGGQMPLQRRLPKSGFSSYLATITDEIRLHELAKVDGDVITVDSLRDAGLINGATKRVKVILAGTIEKAVKLEGIKVTRGAREAIEAAGGTISE